MTSFKTTVAKLSPVRILTGVIAWRTACREEQMERYQKLERTRIKEHAEAQGWESDADTFLRSNDWEKARRGYAFAEYGWRNAWENINPLTPDARQTRNKYYTNIFRCSARERECDNSLRRQGSERKQRAASD